MGSHDPERLRSVNALLEVGLALPEGERSAWLKALPPDQQVFVPLVAGLLARASVETDNFMQQPVGIGFGKLHELEASADQSGDIIGPYRLIHELGAGGMATVWLAERADGVLQRQVALKLPREGWALGLAQRMARERDILGALEHPHIARLYDAGVTASGRPWMAMECVTGVPIDEHCHEHGLGVAPRLRLFLQVAEAVAHAHARLIVHRDLKPSNILVTPEGDVRLLDFGVAKLLADNPATATNLTQVMGRAVTPDYASPEQVAGKPVTVATDVYSLGVVLYELLTGERPYRLGSLSAVALENAILAADVPLASTRVGADRRRARQLRGDLDTVLAKALRKEPGRRYPSVESMVADIERHLAGEAVLARPRSTGYRLAKFVGRYRLQVGAGLAIGVAVMAAAGVSIWQAREARAQAAAAQREAQRAQAVQEVLLSIFKANSVKQADPIRARQTTARELLDIGAAQAAASLAGAPEAQDAVLDVLADMYFQLELGEQAARMRRQRVNALIQAYGPNDTRVADALLAYANDVGATEQPGRALEALAQARQILDRARDFTSSSRGWIWLASAQLQQYFSIPKMRRDADAAMAHFQAHPGQWTSHFHALQAVARSLFLARDFEAAAARHQEALRLAEQHMNGPSAWSITPLVQLAEAQTGALEFDAAEQNLRTALALSSRLVGEFGGSTLQTRAKLGGLLHATGRREEGARLVADAQAGLDRPEARPTPDAVQTVQHFRGVVMQGEGRSAQAAAFYAAEIADLRRQLPDSLPLSSALLRQATPLTALGRYEAAGQALDEAWRLWQAGSGEGVAPGAGNRYRLEQARLQLARHDAAAAEATLAVIEAPRLVAPSSLRVDELQAKLLLSQLRLLQQRPEEALRAAQDALETLRASPLRARFPRLEAEALLRLGQARHSGQLALARADFEQALALRQTSEAATSPWLAEAQIALADCLLDLGERKPAQALFEQARAVHAAHAELGEHFRQPLTALTERLSASEKRPAKAVPVTR
jgi:eukaryotic-like serine/threonine-protein kinase